MQPLATIVRFAAGTAAAVLALCWPGSTYADPPETLFGNGAADPVSFSGEVVRDPSVKTGWAIKVTYENTGDEEETATLDAEVTRATVNPEARSSPPGVAVWRHRDTVTVAAHESAERSYAIPQWLAAQLTSNEKALQLREKRLEIENDKPNPNYALMRRPYTVYGVAFQKADG
jgi:hypothetical protein